MTLSAGMYSSLNQQMAKYHNERSLENTESKHMKYKIAKQRAEEQGMDTSAQKMAMMLERVSNAVEEHNVLSEAPDFKEKDPNQHSILSILIKAIRQKNLNALWHNAATIPARSEKMKQVQDVMQNESTKDAVNEVLKSSAPVKEKAEMTIDELRKRMPKHINWNEYNDLISDTLIGEETKSEHDRDIEYRRMEIEEEQKEGSEHSTSTEITQATTSSDIPTYYTVPKSFDSIMKGTYAKMTEIKRYSTNKKNPKKLVNFMDGGILYIKRLHDGKNALVIMKNNATNPEFLGPDQWNRLKASDHEPVAV